MRRNYNREVFDLMSCSADLAVLLIEKMLDHYVDYVGSLANVYSLRFQAVNANSYEQAVENGHDIPYEQQEEEEMISDFKELHMAVPLAQLFALQTSVQEGMGDSIVSPETITRYLDQRIKTKKGEPYVKDEFVKELFNWDREGKNGLPWAQWILHSLERLRKMGMNVRPLTYRVYTWRFLSEIGIVIEDTPIFIRKKPTIVKSRGQLVDTLDLRQYAGKDGYL
jgi:hypothetical protein